MTMYRLLSSFLLTVFFVAANSALHAQRPQRSATPHAAGEDIYKHYTGTIGDKRVVLDLRYGFQGASNYGGSTYYMPGQEGRHLFIITQPQSFAHDVQLSAHERKEEQVLNRKGAPRPEAQPSWEFTITGDHLTGTWRSANRKEKQPIDLVEDYSKSSAMDMVFFRDSAVYKNAHTNSLMVTIMYSGVVPAAGNKDADFLTDAIIKWLGNGKTAGAGKKDVQTLALKQYFTDLDAKKEQIMKRLPDSVEGIHYHYSLGINLMPVYNDDGILVLRKEVNNYRNVDILPHDTDVYLCLDVRYKREWRYKDIVNADKAAIAKLLEASLRKKYNLADTLALSTWLLTDKLPVTENIMIAHDGLYFTYMLSDIKKGDVRMSRVADVTVFLSYKQLAGMLTPAFKKRMKL